MLQYVVIIFIAIIANVLSYLLEKRRKKIISFYITNINNKISKLKELNRDINSQKKYLTAPKKERYTLNLEQFSEILSYNDIQLLSNELYGKFTTHDKLFLKKIRDIEQNTNDVKQFFTSYRNSILTSSINKSMPEFPFYILYQDNEKLKIDNNGGKNKFDYSKTELEHIFV